MSIHLDLAISPQETQDLLAFAQAAWPRVDFYMDAATGCVVEGAEGAA